MLRKYLRAALRHAKYEILADAGMFYAEIPECRGVYANARTLEACRKQLVGCWKNGYFFESTGIFLCL